MTHYVNLKFGNCWLRPELREDCETILELWNAPFVVGKLFMSKTEKETFLRFYDKYESDPASMSWCICNAKGDFLGTVGISNITNRSCFSGRFAMWPTEDFHAALPYAILRSFLFDVMRLEEEHATYNVENKKIKKYGELWGLRFTGEIYEKPSSAGGIVRLEKTIYTKQAWETTGRKFLHE